MFFLPQKIFFWRKLAAVSVWRDTLFLFPFPFVYFDHFNNSVLFLQTNLTILFLHEIGNNTHLPAWLCRLWTYISYNFQDPSAPVVKSELLIEFYFSPGRGNRSFPLVIRNNDFLVHVITFFNDFEWNYGAIVINREIINSLLICHLNLEYNTWYVLKDLYILFIYSIKNNNFYKAT